jgi:hypothetical protein
MDIKDLIRAAESWNPTEEDIESFRKRMKKAEEKFIEDEKRRAITQEWLNKEYTL